MNKLFIPISLATVMFYATSASAVSGQIQLGVMHANLSSGYSDWNDQNLRLNLQLPTGDQFNAEISPQQHFDDRGTFYGVGYSHGFNDDWYGSLQLGSSSGGFFLPSFRADAFINRKWLSERQLITTLGLGHYQAKDDYRDRSLLLGATYYLPMPLIAEVGMRFNSSAPGAVLSNRQFGVLSYGKPMDYYLTLRHESGDEAYQLIGPSAVISAFSSRETSVSWRQWLTRSFGWTLQLNHYNNPNYSRNGQQVGLFYEF